jgi:6-phosphogluconolactonase (cycloisomerase 2 family)
MRHFARLSAAVTTAALTATIGIAGASSASATSARERSSGVVFVQTNNAAGNHVVAYDTAPNGSLRFAASYATGGTGAALAGAVVDKLASQGSLVTAGHSRLIAVNAGSDTVSLFHVNGDRLRLRHVAGSGGSFPVSVTVHRNLVFVLNALDGGSVQGYRLDGDHLTSLPAAHRSLGLTIPTDSTQFLNTPGQIAFSADGGHLLVSTKANGSHILTFEVGTDGALSTIPVVNTSATPVPFGITFDPAGRVVVAEAGNSSLSTYTLGSDGTLTAVASLSDGQAALCWVAGSGDAFYGANAGGDGSGTNGTISGFRVDTNGHPSLFTLVATHKGVTDLTVSPNGSSLYADTGAAGVVDSFRIRRDGSLASTGAVTVPGGADLEGIVSR